MLNMNESLSQNIVVDKEKCVFCGKCVEVCALDNLRLKLSPCRQACPMGLNCQGYVQELLRGDEEKALEIITEEMPLPGILGRVCHHPCEAECNRRNVDGKGVALRVLKRYLADAGTIKANLQSDVERQEKVAVIGGGPAGIMAAYCLRKKGYQVTVYEAGSRLGGVLNHWMPEFRLPRAILQAEVGILEKMGVNVQYNTVVGKNILLEEIAKKFDAAVVAIGLQAARKLGLPGENAANVYSALDFLEKAKSSPQSIAVGRRVVVVGGGNTAMDVAMTAKRLGSQTVRVVCLEDHDTLPANEEEIRNALAEGIIIEYGWGPKELVVEGGKVKKLTLKRCVAVTDKTGRFNPSFCEGESLTLDTDTIVVAIGQMIDAGTEFEVALEGGYIKTDPLTKQTSNGKVFAAGDAIKGPKSVVDAMAQGREAAESVHRFLMGIPLDFARNRFDGAVTEFEVDYSQAVSVPRIIPETATGKDRLSFKEFEKTITKEQAVTEAKRCLSCGEPYGKHKTCWSCLPCEVECPQKALSVKIPYLMR